MLNRDRSILAFACIIVLSVLLSTMTAYEIHVGGPWSALAVAAIFGWGSALYVWNRKFRRER